MKLTNFDYIIHAFGPNTNKNLMGFILNKTKYQQYMYHDGFQKEINENFTKKEFTSDLEKYKYEILILKHA